MKYPLKYIYHSHTSRCSHAFGEDEDYVINAIKSGVKVLCFTDHTPWPGFNQKTIRMYYEELDEYVSSVSYLKEKYKDKIEIHIGLECEYSDGCEEIFNMYKEKHGVEFFIQGQHGNFINGEWIWSCSSANRTIDEMIDNYVDMCVKGMRSGLFKYLAHPDVIVNGVGKMTPKLESAIRKIIEESIKDKITIEINCQGYRNNPNHDPYKYPSQEFWNIVAEYPKANVVIGLDSHHPDTLIDPTLANACIEIAKKAGIKLKNKVKPWEY